MYGIGDRVGIEVGHQNLYGVVIEVDTAHGAVTVAVGMDRIIQARPSDLWYDESHVIRERGELDGV